MADNQVTTDFIADTSQLEAASMTASAAMAGYEKAAKSANAAVAGTVDQYAKTAAAAHAKVGSAVKLAARDTDQYAKSVANATWQVKALTTAQMKRTLPTPQLPPVQYAPVRRESPNSFTAADLVMDKVDASTKRATASVAVFGETSRRASYQASAGFDSTAARVTSLSRSINAMQKGLRLGGGLIAGIHALGIGASLVRGEFEDAAEQVKSLPFGIGSTASVLERVLGLATGYTQQTEAAKKATEEGNRKIQERAEIIDDMKRRAEEANKAVDGIEGRRETEMAVGDSAKEQVKLEQDHAREMLAITNALADAKKRATELGLSTSGEVDAIVRQMNATRELHQMERRGLETSQRQRQEATAYDLATRLAALNAVDEEERRIIEAKQARTNAVAEAEQAVLDIQLSNQRRGIEAVTAEEQRARDIVTKTKAVQDAMVSAVEREVAERRKATEESRRQAEAVLDARLATEQMRAGGMGATADVYAQTQGTRDELAKARGEGDAAKVEKLIALLSAELQVIGNAAQKQSDDAAQALQEMLASQQRIEVKSVEQASADFRMQEVMAREQRQNIDKQVKAVQAVEERTKEVKQAIENLKLDTGYGP